MITFLETLITNEQNGRFFFNGLQNLENFRPFRYAREVPLQGVSPPSTRPYSIWLCLLR